MQKGEISSGRYSSRSPNCPDAQSLRLETGNDAIPSSLGSDGTPKTKTIAIAVEAHRSLHDEPFAYAINHLVERKNCKVVVICCLSRVQSEMGVDHKIDVEAFTGVSKRVLDMAINRQLKNVNHFLNEFRAELERRGVVMEIRISAGPKSVDILVQAAKALRPNWLVLDRSFSGDQKTLQSELECNLVLMRKPSTLPTVIQLSSKHFGPVDQIPDLLNGDRPEPISDEDVGPNHLSTSCSSRKPSTGVNMRSNVTVLETSQTTTSHSSAKTFSCFTCLCLNVPDTTTEQDGPTKDRAVLYGDTRPGSRAAYLGGMGRRQSIILKEDAMLSSKCSSPASSPLSPCFTLANSNTKKSNKKSLKILESQLEARMAMASKEEDAAYQVQL